MNCSSCNSVVTPNSSFCPSCGERQTQNQPGQDAGFNQQEAGLYNQSPAYPPQGQSYPPQGQNYPSQGQNYPPHGQSFSPQGQSYPQQGAGAFQPGQIPRKTGPKGKVMLQVVGIITIVFGAIGVLSSVIFLVSADYWDVTLPIPGGMSWSVYYAISIFSSIYFLFTGIAAVVNYERPERADFLKILGIISIVRVVLFNIWAVQSGAMAAIGFGGLSLIGLPFELVMPILLVVGANQNLESFRQSQSERQD